MLTKNDLQQIKLLLVSNNSQLHKEFEEIKESIIEEVKDQIKHLPTKELMKEVTAKLENHEERIGSLETKVSLAV